MRSVVTLFVLLFCFIGANAQSFKKYSIGNSGCSAYFFCDPGTFELSKTTDSSDMYTGECKAEDLNYGVILVKLKGKTDDLDKAENVLLAYLEFLKTSLNITKAVGYGKGHTLRNNEKTRGMIDFWEDKDGTSWKIKGWTDGKYIAFMYVYSLKDLSGNKVSLFLDGLVLPKQS